MCPRRERAWSGGSSSKTRGRGTCPLDDKTTTFSKILCTLTIRMWCVQIIPVDHYSLCVCTIRTVCGIYDLLLAEIFQSHIPRRPTDNASAIIRGRLAYTIHHTTPRTETAEVRKEKRERDVSLSFFRFYCSRLGWIISLPLGKLYMDE